MSQQDNQDDKSEIELRSRFDTLSAALEKRRDEDNRQKADDTASRMAASGYGKAFRVTADLVAGVLVGALLGWTLDYLAGTRPWGLIVFLLLGFCAGVMTMLRTLGQMPQAGWQKQNDKNRD
jgi:ATP synthase protein I